MPAGHRASGPSRGAGPRPLWGPVLTRGTLKPLRLTPGVQPKGSETPSSYSAGSQRAKARLEAPSVELRLQGKDRALTVARRPGGSGCRPEWPASPPRTTPPAAAPVVAVPRDGAVLVSLRAGHPHILVGAATRPGQQIQLGGCQHICRQGKGGSGS